MNEDIEIDEACSFLKCSKPRLLQALETGSIPGVRLDQTWVIPRLAFFQAINELAIREAEARRTCAQQMKISLLATESSDRDQVIEEYSHHGMLIRIYRDAEVGLQGPTYFGVVTNPNVKNPSGAVFGSGESIEEIKKIAEARAERKAFLLRRRPNTNDRDPSS